MTLVAAGTCTIRATQSGNTRLRCGVDRPELHSNELRDRDTQRSDSPDRSSSTPRFWAAMDPMASGDDKAFDVVVAPDGSAYVGGSVADSYFPGISSATFSNSGLDLLYVAKMNPDRGQIDVATVVGARSASVTGSGAMAYVGADQVEAMAISTVGHRVRRRLREQRQVSSHRGHVRAGRAEIHFPRRIGWKHASASGNHRPGGQNDSCARSRPRGRDLSHRSRRSGARDERQCRNFGGGVPSRVDPISSSSRPMARVSPTRLICRSPAAAAASRPIRNDR